jgi:hypothetical protein
VVFGTESGSVKGDGAPAATVWLLRSAITQSGMTDGGGVRSVDEEVGIRAELEAHRSAEGEAHQWSRRRIAHLGSSMVRRSSAKS